MSEELGAIPDLVLASWEEQEGESMRDGHAATLKRLIGEALDRAYRLGENAGLEKAAEACELVSARWRVFHSVAPAAALEAANSVRALKGKVSDGENR